MSKLKKFLALTGREKRLFLHALFLLPIYEIVVRTRGLKRTIRMLSCDPRSSQPDINSERIRGDASVIQKAASASLVPARCLARSLYLWRRLLKQGIETELCIGMDPNGEAGFGAHAWLEKDGEILNDTRDAVSRFQTIRFVRDANSSGDRIVEKSS